MRGDRVDISSSVRNIILYSLAHYFVGLKYVLNSIYIHRNSPYQIVWSGQSTTTSDIEYKSVSSADMTL